METRTVTPIIREGWAGKFVAASCPFCGGGVSAQARKDERGMKAPTEQCRHFVSVSLSEAIFQNLPNKGYWTDPQGQPHSVVIIESNKRMTRIEYLDNARRHGGKNGRNYATRRQVWVYNEEVSFAIRTTLEP